ncbi:CHAT domain-containing protein [Leptolyngbya sp. PCC 6406]|uniref:CHAT domain-containing protein n=1 Tax=Leptolyngbya sp. PCC 6406 TaxID=1173264 RepID=UPI001CEDA77A|nr:CHAT domain-containing protein [Leptolyngbya sp. PCC 6406]
MGQYNRAIDLYEQDLAIAREIGDRAGEGITLGNLGVVYRNLGQYNRAIDLYEQHLAIAREIGDRAGEGRALGNLGNAYNSLGQYNRAIDFYEQQLAITREIGDRAGEGRALGNLGAAYNSLGQYNRAIDFYEQQLAITREIGDRAVEGRALGNLGAAFYSLGQYDRALEQFGQAVALFNQLGARAEEAVFLSNIGVLLNDRDQPELAITFLKASVDIRESIRGDIRQLDRDLQQTFTDTIASDYRILADLLLEQDRVLEAQEVLDLLKLQELEDYQLRNVRGTEETRQGISFWPPEQEILDRFYTHLETNTDPQTFFTSAEVTDRVAQLQRNARSQNPNPEQLARLQGNLQQAGNAALLYPLVLDDRLELILVTTSGISRHTVPVDRVELNRAIAAFRSDIEDPFSNSLPNAQQLYQWLIAPLADEIDAAGAETILYAADGQLRYIPLAALHDGDQWLTQRYTLNHITAASLMDFSQAESAPLSILAGAFPAQDLVVEVAGVQRPFSGLPYAQVEVENLQANLPGTVAFFSAGFNRQAIEPRLGNHTIIHLATHGTFQSGHPNDSFILLGDGDRITLFDLDQWQLPNAALVVLSACETAVSGPQLGTGEEILGFGYQIQRTGARAAIASLWVVSDGGTQVLMDAFYGAMQVGLPKAEALRQAQVALITNDFAAVGGNRGIEIFSTVTGQPLVPGGTLAHPYYWAPFILIGNGL